MRDSLASLRSLLFQGRPRRIPGGTTVAGACAPAPSAAGSAAAVPVIATRTSLGCVAASAINFFLF